MHLRFRDVEEKLQEILWTAVRDPLLTFSIQSQPGRPLDIFEQATPEDLFDNFLPHSVFEHLAQMTNKKEVQEGFGQVTVSELYRWLGSLIIFMILRLGISPRPLQTYKANNPPFEKERIRVCQEIGGPGSQPTFILSVSSSEATCLRSGKGVCHLGLT
jgi:uncharacterized protein YneF (UPF0154 family)